MSAERSLGGDEPAEGDRTAAHPRPASVADRPRLIQLRTGSAASVASSDVSTGVTADDPAGPVVRPDTTAPDTVAAGAAGRTSSAERAYDDAWQLVRRTQDGDAEAFGLLYDRYVETVYRFVYYRLGDRSEAEDLTSETFMRALRRISTVHEQGRDIGAWLVTIARNLVLDHVKSAQYRLSIPTAEILDVHHDIHRDSNREAHRDSHGDYYDADATEGGALAALDQRALLEAVSRLSPEQQESIVLRFFQGLSLAETAAVMGRNAGAVKALQHRAMRRLHALLTEPSAPRPDTGDAEPPRAGGVRPLPGRARRPRRTV